MIGWLGRTLGRLAGRLLRLALLALLAFVVTLILDRLLLGEDSEAGPPPG